MVTDVYEPGSVFKSFVAAAGIEHEGMTPDTAMDVPAMVRVGDDEVRDADKRDYGLNMTLREMMRRSSNTGFVLVGEKIGADDFDQYVIKDFGFGTSTGIDFPGESLGIIKVDPSMMARPWVRCRLVRRLPSSRCRWCAP